MNVLSMAVSASSKQTEERLDFTELFQGSFDDLFAYVASLLKNNAAAEEVTAQVFERAYSKRRRYRPQRGSARAWLFGIARNAALVELRKQKKRATLADEPVDDREKSLHDHAEVEMDRQIVRSALKGIPAKERELITLKFGCGLSNGEIANVIDKSESNVGTVLYRTMQKLRESCHEAL